MYRLRHHSINSSNNNMVGMDEDSRLLLFNGVVENGNVPLATKPRKLTFDFSPEPTKPPPLRSSSIVNMSMSPPYRRIRALRLLDTPETPKTIIQKLKSTENQQQQQQRLSCHSLFSDEDKQSDLDNGGAGDIRKTVIRSVPILTVNPTTNTTATGSHTSTANVNPFTPNGMLMNSKKRTRIVMDGSAVKDPGGKCHAQQLLQHHPASHLQVPQPPQQQNLEFVTDDELSELCGGQAPKRLALQDTNISRYEKEFVQLSLIGAGEFGDVFRCLNRLDGCIYAVKKSKKPVAGSAFERIALNEVWAHAVLGKHDNVVRYYSAWAENNHMLIQNEYCNGGSLQAHLQQVRCLTELELRQLVAHIAEGLKYIHDNDLVHLDLKAGNIFLTKTAPRNHLMTTAAAAAVATTGGGGSVTQRQTTMAVVPSVGGTMTDMAKEDDGFVDVYEDTYLDRSGGGSSSSSSGDHVTFKIGDLGHVTSLVDPHVEEGDCRYLPNEILQEDYSHLAKADIFALGMTLFEAASGGPLPKNGPEWHQLRNGNVPRLANLSAEFNDLIRLMMHPDPRQRPSSTSIFRHPLLCSEESKTKSQLCMELTLERQKNEMLLKELQETKKILKALEMSKTPVTKRMGSGALSGVGMIKSDRKLRSYTQKPMSRTRLSLK